MRARRRRGPGPAEYGAQFRGWADHWRAAAEKAKAEYRSAIGPAEGPKIARPIAIGWRVSWPRGVGQAQIGLASRQSPSREPLWIVLIGHGTFDGREAKFNLRGPDVTDAELAEWLAPLKRPVACSNCTSASGRSSTASRARTASSSPRPGVAHEHELRPVRPVPGGGDRRRPAADLDKDGQVSLLEAFLTASSRVDEYYRTRSRNSPPSIP